MRDSLHRRTRRPASIGWSRGQRRVRKMMNTGTRYGPVTKNAALDAFPAAAESVRGGRGDAQHAGWRNDGWPHAGDALRMAQVDRRGGTGRGDRAVPVAANDATPRLGAESGRRGEARYPFNRAYALRMHV